MSNVKNKLEILYQLGLVGLYYDKDIAETHHYVNHICFTFNAGLTPCKDFYNDDYIISKVKNYF